MTLHDKRTQISQAKTKTTSSTKTRDRHMLGALIYSPGKYKYIMSLSDIQTINSYGLKKWAD